MPNHLNSSLTQIQQIGNIIFANYNDNHHHKLVIKITKNDQKIMVYQSIPKSMQMHLIMGLSPKSPVIINAEKWHIEDTLPGLNHIKQLYDNYLNGNYSNIIEELLSYQNKVNNLQPLLLRDFDYLNELLQTKPQFKMEYYQPSSLNLTGLISIQNYSQMLDWMPILQIDGLGNQIYHNINDVKSIYRQFPIKDILQNKLSGLKKRNDNSDWLL